ncbi:MAG: prolyl oligopeptidase family protein [Bacillales bacterium]|jgi:dipeptidyl aminopeptidase/acylaminoacyl peptidase|nr:prolyl oligopeptidase family protein [Bacillales bacterium]
MFTKSFIQINGVNCLLYEPTIMDRKVTIVVYHGWASSIHNQQFLATIFNSHGYTVLIPEVIGHDSRGKLEDYHAQGMWEKYGWRIVIDMVKESHAFFERLTKEDWMKTHKLVLYGNSMGGFISSGIFVQNKYPHSLVLVNTTGDWRALLETGPRKIAEVVIPDEFDALNPVKHVKEIGNRRMLLIHGENDEVVPLETQERFYKETLEKGCQNAVLNKYWHVNHTVGLSMIEDVIGWLNEEYS